MAVASGTHVRFFFLSKITPGVVGQIAGLDSSTGGTGSSRLNSIALDPTDEEPHPRPSIIQLRFRLRVNEFIFYAVFYHFSSSFSSYFFFLHLSLWITSIYAGPSDALITENDRKAIFSDPSYYFYFTNFLLIFHSPLSPFQESKRGSEVKGKGGVFHDGRGRLPRRVLHSSVLGYSVLANLCWSSISLFEFRTAAPPPPSRNRSPLRTELGNFLGVHGTYLYQVLRGLQSSALNWFRLTIHLPHTRVNVS